MKVLVTGATGFIGKEIVSELSRDGWTIIGIGSRKSERKRTAADLKYRAEIITADITASEDISELEKIEKIDVLIHSAGLAHQFGDTGREEFYAVNVEGTRKITNLAVHLNAEHFILISSTAVYGIEPATDVKLAGVRKAFDEDAPTNPQTLYAKSKLEAERVCREICERNDLPLTIFRLSPVIGEANIGNVARLISSLDGGRFLWIGKGENVKSLIYKTDVARACVELCKNKKGKTEVFNLSAEPVRMKDFVREIAGHLDRKVYKFSIPKKFVRSIFGVNSNFVRSKKLYKIETTVEKWLSDDVYPAQKIAGEYGFEPQTSVSEAIERQVKWYQENKENKENKKQKG